MANEAEAWGSDDDFMTLKQPFHVPERNAPTLDLSGVQIDPEIRAITDIAPRYRIARAWPIRGVFQDGATLHGLVYNRHIQTWFHLWWDSSSGRCMTHNCRDGTWDLTR